jgi:hypothetical protein
MSARLPLVTPAALMLVAAAAAFAQQPEPGERGNRDGNRDANRGGGFLIDPSKMLEQGVRDLTLRYKLDEEQRALAREILAVHGKKFFDKHLDEIRALQLEGMKIRFSGEEDPEVIRALAGRLKVILDDAVETLEAAGDDFHEILDEDQAEQHDRERRNFREGIKNARAMLDQTLADGVTPWTRQRMAAGESAEAQARRRRWTGGGFVEREWQAYVEAVVAHYKYDDQQTGRAMQMLELAKKDAAEYRKTRETEIRDVAAAHKRLAEAEAAAMDADPAHKKALADQRKTLDAEADTLEKPLDKMFADLREAVESLATPDQKRRAGPFKPARK